MIKLIGITGKARSGKDTLAQAFVRLGYTRIAFADELKRITALLLNEPVEYLHSDQMKEAVVQHLGKTRRRILQDVGNSMRSAVGPHVWIDAALSAWDRTNRQNAVISDVRYPNEAEAILERGGIIIRVERDGAGLEGEAASHISEAPIPERLITLTVHNNGSILELQGQAAHLSYMDQGVPSVHGGR